MTVRLILCSSCGTKNRLHKDKQKPSCGKCGKLLNANGSSDSFLTVLASVIKSFWIPIIIILFFVGISSLSNTPTRRYTSPTSNQDKISKTAQPAPFKQPVVSISHGVIAKSYIEGVAPFAIVTHAGTNYFIKLVDTATQNEVLTSLYHWRRYI